MTRDRGALPPGMIARGENNRMRNGTCERRPGNILPGEFQAPFEANIIGSAVYRNPNAEEVMLVATAGADYVWALQIDQNWQKVYLDTGLDFDDIAQVEFTQAFEKVLLHQKPTAGGVTDNLIWDGIAGNTFDVVTPSGAGTVTPDSWSSEPFQNRVLFYRRRYPTVPWRDQFAMSDVLDPTQHDDILGVFRINAAESDWITRIWGYYRGSIVVFKERSLHLLSNFTIDPLFAVQNMLTRRLGLAANKGVTEDGHDLLFISEPGGIFRLSEVIQEQIATEPRPVSKEIQPIIDRINWEGTREWGCAATLGDYAFFGVCLDDAEFGCNGILAYYLPDRQWHSAPDIFGEQGDMRINALHVTKAHRGLALYGLDYVNAKIYQLYGGNEFDELIDEDVPIVHTIETRGYTLGAPDEFKRFDRASVAVATSNPNATITAITDGAYEVKQSRTITKSRTKFYQQDHREFVTGDDATEPYRKDYSLAPEEPSDFAGEDFDELDTGPIDELPATPVPAVPVSVKQQTIEPMTLRANGRWVSIRSVNTEGTCDILSVGIEGRPIRARQVAA